MIVEIGLFSPTFNGWPGSAIKRPRRLTRFYTRRERLDGNKTESEMRVPARETGDESCVSRGFPFQAKPSGSCALLYGSRRFGQYFYGRITKRPCAKQ